MKGHFLHMPTTQDLITYNWKQTPIYENFVNFWPHYLVRRFGRISRDHVNPWPFHVINQCQPSEYDRNNVARCLHYMPKLLFRLVELILFWKLGTSSSCFVLINPYHLMLLHTFILTVCINLVNHLSQLWY